ncbi:MAG TPA: hypothetical protein VFW21_13955 [Mycobacterium sp.]|nr:hypothetical protein [Mycobacterium sp.]
MRVNLASSTLTIVCCAAIVVAGTVPASVAEVPRMRATHAPTTVVSDRIALTAAFDPIGYVVNVASAAQSISSDVIYWQTPDFPLLILSAEVNPTTGRSAAAEKISSTTSDLHNLITAVAAIPGVSSSGQVQQLVAGIDNTGAAVSAATETLVTTIKSPLAPLVSVLRVVIAAERVYLAITELPIGLANGGTGGQNPLASIENVISAVSTFVRTVTSISNSLSTASAVSSAAATESSTKSAASTTTVQRSASDASPTDAASEEGGSHTSGGATSPTSARIARALPFGHASETKTATGSTDLTKPRTSQAPDPVAAGSADAASTDRDLPIDTAPAPDSKTVDSAAGTSTETGAVADHTPGTKTGKAPRLMPAGGMPKSATTSKSDASASTGNQAQAPKPSQSATGSATSTGKKADSAGGSSAKGKGGSD